MATKTFRPPQKGGGGGCVCVFVCLLRAFKNIWHTPFLDNWKYSITIGQWRSLGWWQKNFGCHSTCPHHWMSIEIFLIAEKGVGMCYGRKQPPFFVSGDQKILIAIQWCGCVEWRPKFFGRHLTMGLCPIATKFFWLPSHTPPLFDGNRIFSITKKGGHVTFFEKPLTRVFQPVSLCGDQKLLVATINMRRATKFFSRVIQHAPLLDGNWIFFVTQKWKQGLFFQNYNTRPHPFQQLKDFSCHLMVGVCQRVIEKNWSPS